MHGIQVLLVLLCQLSFIPRMVRLQRGLRQVQTAVGIQTLIFLLAVIAPIRLLVINGSEVLTVGILLPGVIQMLIITDIMRIKTVLILLTI